MTSFTEEVEPESATNAANYDFGSGKMSILAIALAPKKDAIDIFLTNSYMVPGPTYTLHFRGVKNTKGNAGEDSKTFRFTGTPDTTRPRLKGIDPNDKGTAVVVSFSKPIQGTATNKDSYTLSQSVNVPGAAWQKSTVDFTVEQAASNAVRLRFSAPLAQNRYRLSQLDQRAGPDHQHGRGQQRLCHQPRHRRARVALQFYPRPSQGLGHHADLFRGKAGRRLVPTGQFQHHQRPEQETARV